MTPRAYGLLITTIGMCLIVPDSLFVRLIKADDLSIAFWRGFTSGAIILMLVVLTGGRLGRLQDVRRTGWPGLLYAFLISTTTIGFVMAISNTSVANAVFIFATLPLFSALFSWLFLAEGIERRTGVTMIVVLFGLGIIAYGSGETEAAHWSGDLWAVYVSAAYAGALTAVRKVKAVPMIPVVPFAYVGGALLLAIFIDPWGAIATQPGLILAHGAFVAVATCLLTLGPRYISAPEVALLVLLESVLAPILVWLVIGEDPGPWALIGGALVLGALLVSNILALRRRV